MIKLIAADEQRGTNKVEVVEKIYDQGANTADKNILIKNIKSRTSIKSNPLYDDP